MPVSPEAIQAILSYANRYFNSPLDDTALVGFNQY